MSKIRRALLSCHDKTGIVELAQVLTEFGVEIISTSGTLTLLRDAGIHAISIADFTGIPELLDGRVKSLHPKVHAGLLGLRDNKVHAEQLLAHGWEWIDLLAVNFRPLHTIKNNINLTVDEMVEQIDIGGAAMMRSAAKNFRYVTVVVDPKNYPRIIHEIRALDGETSYKTRYRLAVEAFACMAAYDAAITEFLRGYHPTLE